MRVRLVLHCALAALGVMAWLIATELPARAVPSFARQTGVSCEACHTSYPELTPFGRLFKLKRSLSCGTMAQRFLKRDYCGDFGGS